MNRNKLKQLPSLAGWLLGAVGVVACAYFILFGLRSEYNADYADTLYWTQAMAEAGALFNTDFHYACLLPFGGSLLMLPFYAVFGVSFATHAGGMLLFLAIFTAAIVFFCRSMKWNAFWTGAAVFTVLGTLCSSEKLREIYLGHIIYYSLGSLFLLVGLGLVLRAGKPKSVGFVLFGLWCFLCSTNGIQSFVLFAVPLLGALFVERLCDRDTPLFSKPSFVQSCPLIGGAVAALAGFLVSAFAKKGITASYEVAFSSLTSPNEWWPAGVENLLSSWVTLFTDNVEKYTAFTSVAGVVAVLRIFFALLVAALPLGMLLFYKKLHRGERLLLVAHLISSTLVLFAFVFGLLGAGNWRLSPMLVSGLLCTFIWIRRMCGSDIVRKRFGYLLLVFCVLIALCGGVTVFSIPRDLVPQGGELDIAQYLEMRGYTYGYANFWNAGAVTVLTDSEVRVRNVSFNADGTVTPHLYQSNAAWYSGQQGQQTYFLLMTAAEHQALSANVAAKIVEVEYYNNFVIARLSGDIFPV